MRAISSGTIAFGLVSIPVKLYNSVSPSEAIRFNTLHKDCGTRVKQQFFCPKCDVAVPRDQTVKGYEFAKGQFVTFSPEELKAVEEQATGGIDITEFVPIDQVDPIYYAKAYFMGPDGGSSRAYNLLAEALRRSKLVALAKYSARGKQYLVLLRPVKEGLIMQQLHYPAEVRDIADVGIDKTQVEDSELALADQLIAQSTSKSFRPEKYSDEVKERVEALIQKKVDGEDITQTEAQSPKTQVIDLMAALKQSLSGGGPAPAAAAPVSDDASDDAPAAKPAKKAAKRTTKKKTKKKASSS